MKIRNFEHQADRTVHYAAPRRGSALLIVLGFLTFMMISAVSFAVYMRIERQASSNYRHSTTARHMLNAALYRAIDEIDSELRVPAISGIPAHAKFPTNWPGRVKTSAVANGDDNSFNTRVLTMEALSFIPGVFVNDVRRYANPHRDDPRPNTDADQTLNWRGAKWRTLKDMDNNPVGRYAYLCVNVSDMLDVNLCRAMSRGSATNGVSISHLFNTDAERIAFDNLIQSTDGKYLTLQDFYACLDGRGDSVFTSPYHEFADPVSSGTDIGFNNADNHVLITGSRALPEPLNNNDPQNPPLNLYGLGPNDINAEFVKRLEKALDINLNSASQSYAIYMIKDYLDTDSVPSSLCVPCVEMVPMVSQIGFTCLGDNTIMSRPDPADPANKTINYLQLGSPGGVPYGTVFVETVWPFKHWHHRNINPNSFKVRVHAFVNVVSRSDAEFNRMDEFKTPYTASRWFVLAPQEGQVNFTMENNPSYSTADIDNFYSITSVMLPNLNQQIDIIKSDGTLPTGDAAFAAGNFISVATVIFAQVVDANGYVVDQVPTIMSTGSNTILIDDFEPSSKLFFQTDPAQIVATPMSFSFTYKWQALETPDPRWNHKASNWMQWMSRTGKNFHEPEHNKSTELLLGQAGRDNSIFMSVADTGQFQSPGELGFIVRPVNVDIIGTATDLSDPAHQTANDAEHLFRTIRLYDHGGNGPQEKRDKIYDYFYLADPSSGTLSGARVNPLSDIPLVLEAAIGKTPLDYWIKANNTTLPTPTATQDYTFNSYLAGSWDDFADGWFGALVGRAKTKKVSTKEGEKTVAESFQVQMRDVYGLNDTMGWYQDDPQKIFNAPHQTSMAAAAPLHEVDRKMLYSVSLDSFCDRQQLFLYIIRAEVTSPTLFSSATEARSLAGGRAVALVWRDPYPAGYDKQANSFTFTLDTVFENNYNALRRVSPWVQHNEGRKRKYDESQYSENDPVASERRKSYHAHRILFFKQLDK